MSTQVAEATSPVDPLERLRSADSRPLVEQWREKLAASLRQSFAQQDSPRSRTLFRVALAALCALLLVAIVWRTARADPVPVEQSLPFAAESATATATVARVQASVGGAAGEGASAVEGPGAEDGPAAVVVVHVAGAVQRPGLVRGEAGWRVADAIEAASGPVPNADLDRINLAAPLRDGERIYVPLIGEDPPPSPAPVADVIAGGGSEQAPLVNLNSADANLLEQLPGVGPATAQTIIEHRSQFGTFASVDSLIAVRGIGAAKLDAIRDYVTVG